MVSIINIYLEKGFFVSFEEGEKKLTSLFGCERLLDAQKKGYSFVLTKDKDKDLNKVCSVFMNVQDENFTINAHQPA